MNPRVKARKIVELVKEGMSVEEASLQVLEEIAEEFGPITDRVEWIKGLKTLDELRRAKKSAHGKKSKAVSEEKKAKYQAEIEAADMRMNEIIARSSKEADPIKSLIELGESPKVVLHNWIRGKEEELKEKLGTLGLSKNRIKALAADQPAQTPPSIQEELRQYDEALVDLYEQRLERCDQGVIAINRKTRLIESSSK